MAVPIYKVFIGRMTEAWDELSEEEQNSLGAKVRGALEKAGGKTVILCRTLGGPWQFFGVEEFPDVQAAQKHTEAQRELHWGRYHETVGTLGTKWEPS
ncbi:MAG: hypothetical protein E3J25_05940 [Anaerolineales bacterium]|nr:MAG: hypothetical protein E3J25_05940 [Anaerolineales bacterium]